MNKTVQFKKNHVESGDEKTIAFYLSLVAESHKCMIDVSDATNQNILNRIQEEQLHVITRLVYGDILKIVDKIQDIMPKNDLELFAKITLLLMEIKEIANFKK